MNRAEFEVYIELYRRKKYAKIPIGAYPDGTYFYMTAKQIRALELLNDGTTTHVGYGGSARCFAGNTLVQTNEGHKRIDEIKKGDLVLSFNERKKEKEFKKVLKTFRYRLAEPPLMAIFANNLICKYDHKFLFRGEWTKAFELRERSLETNTGNLFCFNEREDSYIKPSRNRKAKINESGKRWKRIFKNSICSKWNKQHDKSSSRNSKNVYSESAEPINSESQEFYKNRQQNRKSGVDEPKGKCNTRIFKRSSWKYLENWRASARELFEDRRKQWDIYLNREACIGDKSEVCSEKIYTGNASEGIRSKTMHDKGCNPTSFLESREITDNEIDGMRFAYIDAPIYDLHVEDNFNYTVTSDNIIVHNSGKSIIECTVIIFDCFAYPDIAWGLARKALTTLKRTVLLTLFGQFDFYGLTTIDYNYNQQLNKISFVNKSEIFLIDTAYMPSDPLNTRFGGFELTRSAIDESNETNILVVNKLFERTGWRNNDTYGIKRKQFECFNPDKNHVYSRFFLPFRDNKETEYCKFIPALPSDNPNPSVKEWIEDIVRTGDTATIERQIHGNFDFDDDPSKLCEYDAICDMFTNSHVIGGQKYISADLAMQGRDKFVGGVWNGLICTISIDIAKCSGRDIELKLLELKTQMQVGNSNIVADSDGLGNYLESYIKNIKSFHGGAAPKDKEQYGILKDECGFKLAEVINLRKIKINCTQSQEDEIKKELSICLKRDNVDNDKKRLIKKDLMKEKLGHSPDYLDMLIMRMYFEINPTRIPTGMKSVSRG